MGTFFLCGVVSHYDEEVFLILLRTHMEREWFLFMGEQTHIMMEKFFSHKMRTHIESPYVSETHE